MIVELKLHLQQLDNKPKRGRTFWPAEGEQNCLIKHAHVQGWVSLGPSGHHRHREKSVGSSVKWAVGPSSERSPSQRKCGSRGGVESLWCWKSCPRSTCNLCGECVKYVKWKTERATSGTLFVWSHQDDADGTAERTAASASRQVSDT